MLIIMLSGASRLTAYTAEKAWSGFEFHIIGLEFLQGGEHFRSILVQRHILALESGHIVTDFRLLY